MINDGADDINNCLSRGIKHKESTGQKLENRHFIHENTTDKM